MWTGFNPVTKELCEGLLPLATLFPQLSSAQIRSISGNSSKICVVLTEGQLHEWVAGDAAAKPPTLRLVMKNILEVRVGLTHVVALATAGTLHVWGSDPVITGEVVGPENVLPCGDCQFVSVRCGSQHNLALTSRGEIYSWGYGSYGQLGHGDTNSQTEPKLIEALAGLKVVAIECGSWHSVFLTGKELSTSANNNESAIRHVLGRVRRCLHLRLE